MSKNILPKEFNTLEIFCEKWALPDSMKIYETASQATLSELKVFHDKMLEQSKKIIGHLDKQPVSDFDEQHRNLASLMCSFAVVAPLVEIYKQNLYENGMRFDFREN